MFKQINLFLFKLFPYLSRNTATEINFCFVTFRIVIYTMQQTPNLFLCRNFDKNIFYTVLNLSVYTNFLILWIIKKKSKCPFGNVNIFVSFIFSVVHVQNELMRQSRINTSLFPISTCTLLRNHYVKELQKIKSASNRYPVKITHCDYY